MGTETEPRKPSRLGIIRCILKNSVTRSSKIELTCVCELNPSQFDLYVDFLVKMRLLEVSGKEEAEAFETTRKGEEFLRDCAWIERLLAG